VSNVRETGAEVNQGEASGSDENLSGKTMCVYIYMVKVVMKQQ